MKNPLQVKYADGESVRGAGVFPAQITEMVATPDEIPFTLCACVQK